MTISDRVPILVDVRGGERLDYAGMELVIRASAESTNGAFSIVEEINAVDAPLHIHHNEDEVFWVLEGRHVFTVGEETFEAGPGDMVFGPRGVPHSQRRVIPRSGRTLSMFSPAGFEVFFRDLAEADEQGIAGPELLNQLADKYGFTWVR